MINTYGAIRAHDDAEAAAGAHLIGAPFSRVLSHPVKAGRDFQATLGASLYAEAASLAQLDVYLNPGHGAQLTAS